MFHVVEESKNVCVCQDADVRIFLDPENMNLGYTCAGKTDAVRQIPAFLRQSNHRGGEHRGQGKNLMLRLLITSKCNLNCEYCQMKKLMYNHRGIDLSKDQIDAILAKVAVAHYDYITIHFSGGEPLVSKYLIEYTCDKVQELQIKNVRFAISTNGTLLDEKTILMLKKYDVQTVVSIDGLEEDGSKRRDYAGHGSVRKVLDACAKAKSMGLRIGISTVFLKGNADKSVDIIKELYAKYAIDSVGFNYQHYSGFEKGNIDTTDDYMQIYADTLCKVSNYCSSRGIFEEQSNRVIEPFATGNPRKSHCSSQTSQVTVMPNGRLGPCKTFASVDFDCAELNEWLNDSENATKIFNKWHSRLVENIPQCSNCPYRGMCGGGCPYEAFVDFSDIQNPDKRYCVVPKTLFLNMMEQLKLHNVFADASEEIKLIAPETRAMLLTCKKADKYKLTASIGHFQED